MAVFPCSVLALAVLVQASPAQPPPPPDDSSAAARIARDSSDAGAWLALGRAYLERANAYHQHASLSGLDSVTARAALDSADFALGRAADVLGGTGAGDSARALRVEAVGARALLAWEAGGIPAAAAVWSAVAADVRPPPLLEELGENLLRACPQHGVLLTAARFDTEAAWYMHFASGLRRDLVIVPLALWRSDTVFRRRVTGDLDVPPPAGRGGEEFPWLRQVIQRQPVCASMGFERPPSIRRGLDWKTRPLLWVAGPRADRDRVPARDFVFAALRMSVDAGDSWLEPVLALYRRAARADRHLCGPLRVYGLRDDVGCR